MKSLLSPALSAAGFAILASEVNWHITASIVLIYASLVVYASTGQEKPRG